ncbi:GAF domain-containing protein [Rhodococcus spelaei]|uniref:GAF domain-containing protein n=1 Tax=Rhodococcus spelaei TaxID=2546320 RepID=A0A541BQE1_9NOCA|nr:GAF domain-containing protein [Rhodococcus spelaei]TQF74557.1 GAF domain-containing protein [Rhodococcus spelaei]
MDDGWLHLLLDEATPEQLIAHRDRLLAAAPERAPAVERDTQAALALRLQLEQRRQRATELAALNDIASQLTTLHDPAALLTEIAAQARRLLGVDLVYIGLVSGDNVVIEVASGAFTSRLVGLSLSRTEGLMGRVMAQDAPLWTPDYRADPTFPHTGPADVAARSENMRGLLAVPLRHGGRMLGAVCACKRQERTFSDDEVVLLSALAAHAAVAIDNARSIARSKETVAALEDANTELARRTDLLERTLRWDRALTQVVLRGGGVRELVAEVSESAGCPAYFVLGPDEVPAGLGGHRDAVASVFDALDSGADRQVAIATREGRSLVGREVRAAGDRLGVLLLLAPSDPVPVLPLILERATPAIALALVGERAAHEAGRRARDALVVDLITRPAPTADESQQQFRLAGLNPDRRYTVAVARPESDVARTRSQIEDIPLPQGTVVAEHGSRVIVLVPGLAPAAVLEIWTQPDTAPTVGLADPAGGGEGLARAYSEAQQTVDVLETLGRGSQVAAASRLGIYRILLSRTGRAELTAVTEQMLGPLLREQEQRGVPLLDTLASYLEHNRRHAATAADLAIHANTLYQRLESIDRLIGKQWRDPDRALDLQLLLRLRSGACRLD